MFSRAAALLDAPGQDAAEKGVGIPGSWRPSRTARRLDHRRRHVATGSGRTAATGPCAGRPASMSAQPWRPEANSVGKSSCSSRGAERGEQVEHLVVHLVRRGRPARSTLLITTIGVRPRRQRLADARTWSAAAGPRRRRTSTMAPSTMIRMRSTSPPKSAWPGVSTMLIRTPFQTTEVHLARMVMPRSRSRSLRSIARSATCWLVAEGAGLLQQLVDQRGLAVVDMGDDRDVADFHTG